MLILVLSPPSPASTWAIPLIRSIVQTIHGPTDYFHLSTADRLREDWQARKSDHIMLYTDCPDVEIANILSRNAVQTILLQEDPIAGAHHLRKNMGLDPAAAIRNASSAFATLHDLILNTYDLLPITELEGNSSEFFVRQVAEFLGLELMDEQIRPLLERNANLPATDAASAVDCDLSHASSNDHEAALFAETLQSYRAVFHSHPADQFVWPPSLFFMTDPLGAPLTGDIELTGPARPILYGPYLHLPIGAWEARVQFEVSGNLSGNVLFVEFLAGTRVLSKWRAKLPKVGAFDFVLPFVIEEPRDPLQIRFSILEGAIEGLFSLNKILVGRVRSEQGLTSFSHKPKRPYGA